MSSQHDPQGNKLPEILIKGRPYSLVRNSVLSFHFIKAIPPQSEIRVWLPDNCTCRSRSRPCEHIKKALEIFQSTNTITLEEAVQKIQATGLRLEHDKTNEAHIESIEAVGILESIEASMESDDEEGNE